MRPTPPLRVFGGAEVWACLVSQHLSRRRSQLSPRYSGLTGIHLSGHTQWFAGRRRIVGADTRHHMISYMLYVAMDSCCRRAKRDIYSQNRKRLRQYIEYIEGGGWVKNELH
jgi:hypothetical protein